MTCQNTEDRGIDNGSVTPARKPWVTPRLIVSEAADVTQASFKTTDDGLANLLS